MQATDVQMIADRWMLESRRLINWGSYEGYHEFRPSTDHKLPVTLLAGASESGKSTLVDAQISLLYPTGTPFNKASNSGRSERSDYTYLRGMVGVGSTETGDEPLYLRGRDENGAPQPVWGAIVDTYRNQTTGQVLSCAKFLYLMPGDGRGDVRRQYVVWGKPVDPRRMDQYRDAPFTPAQLKATYPDCLTFPSAEAFHTHIWSAMGLSEAACRLLHKIQSADAPSRLDDIFKQGVLGVPEALDLARTTVEDYERYDENFHAMDEKTRRMDTLRGIQQAYGEYAAARGKARAFEPVKPAVDGTVPAVLRDWALARMRGEVAVQLPADSAEQQNSEAEAKLLRRRQCKRIHFHTFGAFDMLVDGEPVHFRSGKAKELMALCVYRDGRPVSIHEIVENLWGENADGTGYRRTIKELADTLRDYGAEEMFLRSRGSLRVRMDLADSDFQAFMSGDEDAICQFQGVFMQQYSWAEPMVCTLQEKKELMLARMGKHRM